MELSIVVPFYNEGANVLTVLEKAVRVLDSSNISYELIAVDNGSVDSTGEFIDRIVASSDRVRKVRVERNRGYGFGIRQGLDCCRGDIVGYMWGDDQISSDVLPLLLQKLRNERLHLCKVVRVVRTESFVRRFLSFLYNRVVMNAFFMIVSDDINGCPKIMPRTVYKRLRVSSNDWFIDPEILMKCKRKKFKVGEIPVTPIERALGGSHVRWSTCVEFFWNILYYALIGRR